MYRTNLNGGTPTENTELDVQRLPEGDLVSGFGGFYTVVTATGEHFTLRAKKKFRRQKLTPTVGDRIRFTPGHGEEEGWIEEILPRTSLFIRPPVANVTLLLAVVAPVPEPDLLLVDRMLVRAHAQNVRTAIVVTKADLDADLAEKLREQYDAAGIPVYSVCSRTGEGFDALRTLLKGETCCLSGQSGVGKSTLLNALLGLTLETGEISEKIQRGKNTTRKAELLLQGGLRIFDTAGFSLLELESGMDPVELRDYYPEFVPHAGHCRFDPCYHDREPGCVITEAVTSGELNGDRVARYRQLLAECRDTWRKRYD